jgi:hypothetical protein
MTAKEAKSQTETNIQNVECIMTLVRAAIYNEQFAIWINDIQISNEQQQQLRRLGYSFEIDRYGRKSMSWKNAV